MQDETSVKMPGQAVAVIGGGPAGLVVVAVFGERLRRPLAAGA